MLTDAFWIILTGCLVSISSGLLGCYLILRRMAMVGDAISHAVLPGIAIAFLVSGSRSSVPMLIGAALVGMFCTVLIELFHKKAKLQEDASIGISFTWLFAVGVILITFFADTVDLDQECVLYGDITFVNFETTAGVPNAVWMLGAVCILVISAITIGYKGLFITTFDPDFAATLGISTALWHYGLMGAVSINTVMSFESVGAILVVAFMIVPGATAYLLTHSLKKMLWLSVAIGIIASISGYYFALWLNASVSGGMVTMLGLEFVLAGIYTALQKRKKQQIAIE